MKNKRLIILISIFAFLILVVILCSTLFTVNTITVNWLTRLPEGHILINKDDEIANSIEKGGSIFLYDKNEAIIQIEEKFPYLNVVKIETKFPNKLVLHVADRQEMFALKINNNCYAIIDGTSKVLAKYNAVQYEALSLTSNPPVLVTVEDQAISEEDVVVGKNANISRVSSVLHSSYEALKRHGYKEIDAKGFIKQINIDLGYNSNVTILTTYNIGIKITKISENLTDKIVGGITAYNIAHDEGKSNGIIVVRQLSSGVIEGEFVSN